MVIALAVSLKNRGNQKEIAREKIQTQFFSIFLNNASSHLENLELISTLAIYSVHALADLMALI
jgi:hypothetical protein